MKHHVRILARLATALALIGLVGGCTSTRREPPRPEPSPPPVVATTLACDEGLDVRIAELELELAGARTTVEQLRRSQDEMRIRLSSKEEKLASVEERYAVLETELTSAVEQVIRSEGGVRGLQSRALAASRISEVRVQMVAVPMPEDLEVSARLARASDYLDRADAALDQGTFGAASYLAERADELVRQAKIVGQIRASRAGVKLEIIPIVPPRDLVLTTNANLRAGPGLDQQRVGGMKAGSEVVAVARAGEWYRVQTDSGDLAWIHGRLLE